VPWTCTVCGELHDEQLRDIRAGLPDPVFEIDEVERRERVDSDTDWCRFVDQNGALRLYVRGVLHLPIKRSDDDFRFGVWVEVGEADFYRLGDLWHDEDGMATRPFFGWLANKLNLYPGTLGLPVALQLRDVHRLPAVILLDAEHPIVVDQRRGIDEEQANRLAETVLH
jgi:hypothetical protein